MLKQKICVICGLLKYIFSRGRCKECAMKTYAQPKKQEIKQKVKTPKFTKEKPDKSDLNKYFDDKLSLLISHPYSEESGKFISNPSRFNVCHLFPKSLFPSVRSHKINYVFLTTDEHTDFDRHMFNQDFEAIVQLLPNSHKLIFDRMNRLVPFIKERKKMLFNFLKFYEKFNSQN